MHKITNIIQGLENDYDIESFENDLYPEGNSCFLKIAEFLNKTETEISKNQEAIEADTLQATQRKAEKRKNYYCKILSPIGFKKKPSVADFSKSITNHSANEDVALITHKTSNDAIKSIYSLVTTKLPLSNSSSIDFSKSDKRDIQNIFQKKTKEFQMSLLQELGRRPLTPYEISKKERLQKLNSETDRKQEGIYIKKQEDEIKRIYKSNQITKIRLAERLKEHTEKALHKMKKNMKLERNKKKLESRQAQKQEKEIIIENIKNFYKDRISLLKEKIDQEKVQKKIYDYERKKVLSDAEKERKIQRKMYLEQARSLIDNDNSKLNSDLLNFENIEEKLLKYFKRIGKC